VQAALSRRRNAAAARWVPALTSPELACVLSSARRLHRPVVVLLQVAAGEGVSGVIQENGDVYTWGKNLNTGEWWS